MIIAGFPARAREYLALVCHRRSFPTKRHWRSRSRIEEIEAGLRGLVEEIGRPGVRSIAIPPSLPSF
jgi:hypothetical protein